MNSDMTGKIAFQGEIGAFSHQACREVYPAMEPMPCATFEDAIAAVRGGSARLAMLPVENSLYGRVADIHHLLPDSGLYIIGEHFVPIRLQLLAKAGTRLEDIREAQSHTVALGQCQVGGGSAVQPAQFSHFLWRQAPQASFGPLQQIG